MSQPLLIPILWNERGDDTSRRPKYRERYQHFSEWRYPLLGIFETVEEGTVIDGASVPRIAWWFLPPDGLHRRGAAAHDDIYGRRGKMGTGRQISREKADLILFDFMREAGVPYWRCVIVYRAVRMFGWYAWAKSKGVPIVLPVRQAARTIHKTTKNPLRRHIYSAPILTP